MPATVALTNAKKTERPGPWNEVILEDVPLIRSHRKFLVWKPTHVMQQFASVAVRIGL